MSNQIVVKATYQAALFKDVFGYGFCDTGATDNPLIAVATVGGHSCQIVVNVEFPKSPRAFLGRLLLLPYHLTQHRADVGVYNLQLTFHVSYAEVVHPAAGRVVEQFDAFRHGYAP